MTEDSGMCLYQDYRDIDDLSTLQGIIRDCQSAGQTALERCSSLSSRECTQETNIAETMDGRNVSQNNYSQWLLAEGSYLNGRSPVVFLDDREFDVKRAETLKGKFQYYSLKKILSLVGRPVIASKLPSRWPGTVYVYTQSALSAPQDTTLRACVSRKKGAPDGLRWSKTLHLNKLPLETKVRILSGRIKWLFVVQADSRQPIDLNNQVAHQ